MVVADTWAEQKVLMRAFASSLDQTQPTIGLQGRELAISPAGTDPHGPWGIHVQPPADGWAQELRGQLELAAKHLAGSKGNPPRLLDEVPADERRPTSPWLGPRDNVARAPDSHTFVSSGHRQVGGPPPPVEAYRPTEAAMPSQSVPARRHRRTRPPPVGSRTASGFATSSTPVPTRRPYHRAPSHASLATTVGKTMPVGFNLADSERVVLDALSRGELSGGDVARLTGAENGHQYMGKLLDKLAGHGLDLVEMHDGVYRLRSR